MSGDNEICEIQIKRGKKPPYTEIAVEDAPKKKIFYVRYGNSYQGLEIDKDAKYMSDRFSE